MTDVCNLCGALLVLTDEIFRNEKWFSENMTLALSIPSCFALFSYNMYF